MLLAALAVLSADATKPHINTGVNAPFATKAPDVRLSAAEEATLAEGRMLTRQVLDASGKGGRALAVMDVLATPNIVWARLLAFSEYPRMVKGVAECGHYAEVKHRNGSQTLKTRMKLSIMGVKLEYFVHHTYEPNVGVLTWTLDYTRLSDLIDSVGYWSVSTHPTKQHWSRIFYSVDAALPGWVPGFVVSAVTSKALADATSWVKTESEAEQLKAGSTASAAPRSAKQCRLAGGTWTGTWRKRRCELPVVEPAAAADEEPTRVQIGRWAVAAVVGGIAVARHVQWMSRPWV